MKPTLLLMSVTLILLSPAEQADARVAAGRLADGTGSTEAASARGPQETAHLVTVLVPTLDDPSARALVIRRPTHPGNLILVTAETTPRELLNALRALNRSRREVGEESAAELRAFIRRGGRGDGRDETSLERAAAHLSRVKAAPERSIEGVGSYRAVTTSLPQLRQ